ASQTIAAGTNLYALRRGAAAQYGLGSTASGQRPGMLAGAAGVANALRDKTSAVCVFAINEGWWFITVRNNLILSEEDRIYTSEDEARDAFDSMLAIPDWGYRIAPESWGIEDTKELQVTDLLAHEQPPELKRIVSESSIKNAILLAVLASLAGGYYWYSRYRERIRLESEERRRRAEEEARAKAPPPPPPPPAPWESLIDIEDMAKKCTVLIVNSTAAVPGWMLTESTCGEKQVADVWKRTYGTSTWIFDSQKYGFLSKAVKLKAQDKSYNTVTGTIDIPMIAHVSREPAFGKVELQKKLTNTFQSIKLVNFKLDDKTLLVKDPNNQEYQKTYRYTSFSFDDAAYRMPLDWVKLLKDMNSIEFNSIKWDNSARKWTYEGKIYEKEESVDKAPAPDAGGAVPPSVDSVPSVGFGGADAGI
ncbi:MAG: type 4b pilus protein PilO2, partial [Rickettsiales bacterium]|nr:type 4b pilus protein PilO2 [Rickettsiales bacterium]